ncbi:High Affinity Immunoglobulin Epsilon Receptor Subunit Beta, partial [Manis pentadactyla]
DISITERVRFWVCDLSKMLEQGYGEAWVTPMFQGECAIQFQDYSEAIVVSMLILEFQATGSAFSISITGKKKSWSYDRVQDVGTGYGEVTPMFQ